MHVQIKDKKHIISQSPAPVYSPLTKYLLAKTAGPSYHQALQSDRSHIRRNKALTKWPGEGQIKCQNMPWISNKKKGRINKQRFYGHQTSLFDSAEPPPFETENSFKNLAEHLNTVFDR